MNCQDVIAFVIEPGSAPPESVDQHVRSCTACRARAAEARRVALLLADLPVEPDTGVAEAVMRRIGYGNGRPTREKILEQMHRVRDELVQTVDEVNGAIYRPGAPGEPSSADLVAHLPAVESALRAAAQDATRSDGCDSPADSSKRRSPAAQSAIGLGSYRPDRPADAASRVARAQPYAGSANAAGSPNAGAGAFGSAKRLAGHTHTAGAGEESMEDLRGVRERTLRLVSELGDAPAEPAAETLRSIYRHEAQHASQLADVLWRIRRKDALGDADL